VGAATAALDRLCVCTCVCVCVCVCVCARARLRECERGGVVCATVLLFGLRREPRQAGGGQGGRAMHTYGAARARPRARPCQRQCKRNARDASMRQRDETCLCTPGAPRDGTCPISTEGWTRRVHFVREGGGGGARDASEMRQRPAPGARPASAVALAACGRWSPARQFFALATVRRGTVGRRVWGTVGRGCDL
jgi:hypothetical protein